MKIILKSMRLFLAGLYAECYKRRLDKSVSALVKGKKDFSGKSLARRSNKCCRLFERFSSLEEGLKEDMALYAAGKGERHGEM